jgi:hypothetical protein
MPRSFQTTPEATPIWPRAAPDGMRVAGGLGVKDAYDSDWWTEGD